jgi:hypothetical protein
VLLSAVSYSEYRKLAKPTSLRTGVNICPEAWYLQRHGTARSAAAEGRLRDGLAAHERIGRQTDGLLDLERGRRWLLLAIALLVVVLVLQLIAVQGVPHP